MKCEWLAIKQLPGFSGCNQPPAFTLAHFWTAVQAFEQDIIEAMSIPWINFKVVPLLQHPLYMLVTVKVPTWSCYSF
jgi:hypothetical protein